MRKAGSVPGPCEGGPGAQPRGRLSPNAQAEQQSWGAPSGFSRGLDPDGPYCSPTICVTADTQLPVAVPLLYNGKNNGFCLIKLDKD